MPGKGRLPRRLGFILRVVEKHCNVLSRRMMRYKSPGPQCGCRVEN